MYNIPTIDQIAQEITNKIIKKHGSYFCWRKAIPSAQKIWNNVYGIHLSNFQKFTFKRIKNVKTNQSLFG